MESSLTEETTLNVGGKVNGNDDPLIIDLDIFQGKLINDNCDTPTDCKAVERILTTLIYYQRLSKSKRSIFSQFLCKSYSHYLDDITHLLNIHEQDLEEINEMIFKRSDFTGCDINHCLTTDRHYDLDQPHPNTEEAKRDSDATETNLERFHQQTWDSVHFYVVHLFELGLRQKKDELKTIFDVEDDNDCLDTICKQQQAMIKQKRQKLSRFFGRFKSESNKFNIQTSSNPQTNTQNETDNSMFNV